MAEIEDGVFVTLRFTEQVPIGARDLSSFLFDVNKLYVIAFTNEQNPVEFAERRSGSVSNFRYRISTKYQLTVSSIRFQSPGLIVLSTVIGSIGAIWGFVQIIDKVMFWPLQREKIQLEIVKLRTETIARRSSGDRIATSESGLTTFARLPLMSFDAPLSRTTRRRPHVGYNQRIEPVLDLPATRNVVNRLSKNPLKPTDLSVDIIDSKNLPLY